MKFGKLLHHFRPYKFRSCVYNSNLGHNSRAFLTQVNDSIMEKQTDIICSGSILDINKIALRKICKKFDKQNNTTIGHEWYENENKCINHCFLSRFFTHQLEEMLLHTCSVCFSETCMLLVCGHPICSKCKKFLLICPVCRRIIL